MNTIYWRKIGALTIAGALCSGPWNDARAQETPKQLKVVVIGGEGPIDNVKQRTAREPVIEVQEENNRPVAGAAVFFKLPNNGASGNFVASNSKILTVTTDQQGRAAARFTPNQNEGDLAMQVTASFAGLTASTVIRMHIGPHVAGHAPVGKIVTIAAAVGAAAAIGIVLGTRGGSSSTPASSPTTITVAGTTVGSHP